MAYHLTHVVRPVNYQDGHQEYFAGQYETPANEVVKINNAVLLFNGIVIRNALPVKGSYYQYAESKWGFIKKAYQQYLLGLFSRSRKLIKHDESPLIVINQPWFNFYHWMLESLPRLYMSRHLFKTAKIILPESYSRFAFVQESLKLIKDLPPVVYNPDENFRVKELNLPALRPYCHAYNVDLLQGFKDWMLQLMGAESIMPGRRIFLVRRKAGFRRIENQDAIESMLVKYGFEAVDLEDYNLIEQVKLTRSATHVVAQHGAGLTHILFMHPQARVLELHKKITNKSDHFSKVYWTLASAMKVDYYYMFCEPVNRGEDFFKADIHVDAAQFETELINFVKA